MCQVILWGAVLLCHAPVQDFSGLAAARTFLGVFEASIQVRNVTRLPSITNRTQVASYETSSQLLFSTRYSRLVLLYSLRQIH